MIEHFTIKILKSMVSALILTPLFFVCSFCFSQTVAAVQYRCGSSNQVNVDQLFKVDFPTIPSSDPTKFVLKLLQINSLPLQQLSINGRNYNVDIRFTYPIAKVNISTELQNNLVDTLKAEIYHLDNAFPKQLISIIIKYNTEGIVCQDKWGEGYLPHFAKNDTFCVSTSEPTILNVVQNDFITLGQNYSTAIINHPLYGSISKNSNGLNYTYTFRELGQNSIGIDSFTYSLEEKRTGEMQEATVYINLNRFEIPTNLDFGCKIDFTVTEKILNSGKWFYNANEIKIDDDEKANSKMNLTSSQATISWVDDAFTCATPIPLTISKIEPTLNWESDILNQGICTQNAALDLYTFLDGADNGQWFLDGYLIEGKVPTSTIKDGKHALKFSFTNGNCKTEIEDSILFHKPNADIQGIANEYCKNNASINLANFGSGIWKVNGITTTVFSMDKEGFFNIEYTAQTTDNCVSSSTKKVFVLEDPKSIDAGLDINLTALDNNFVLNASTIPNGYEAEWLFDKNFIGLNESNSASTSGMFFGQDSSALVWKISSAVCPEYKDTLIIRKERINISGGISPNGDEMNDAFEIIGLATNTQVQLTVINRWGQTILDIDNYKNDWFGTFQNGSPLPEDVYYYTVKIKDGKTIKGTFVIKK